MRLPQMAITALLLGAARGLLPRSKFGAQKPITRGLARRRAARKLQAKRIAAPMPEAPREKLDDHARRLTALQGYTALVLNADWQPLSYLPLSVWSWQDAVKAAWQERVHVVSSYDVRVHSASASFAIPSVVVLRNYERRGTDKAPKFSKRLMMLRDNYCCQYCKGAFPPSMLTCDHVVPKASGGASTWENTVCACTACNEKKASLLPSQLKTVGMRLPQPRAPSAHQLEAAARGLCLRDLQRKTHVHESWKLHIGAVDDATVERAAHEDARYDVTPRKMRQRDRSVAYSR